MQHHNDGLCQAIVREKKEPNILLTGEGGIHHSLSVERK